MSEAQVYEEGGIVPTTTPRAGWPGAPKVDVPGLEEPATFTAAALSEGGYGHRAVLVIASEDGAAPTTAQLAGLADALDELYAGEAPEGSRAWLREEMARLRTDRDRLRSECSTRQQRAERAEAALRDRSAVDDDGLIREALSLELANERRARDEQQGRVESLYARLQAAEGRGESLQARAEELAAQLGQARHELAQVRAQQSEHVNELLAAIRDDGPYPRGPIADHLHNLRGRAEAAERALDKLRGDRVGLVEQLMAERDGHETARTTHGRVVNELQHTRGERDAQATRAEEAEERYRNERDLRRLLQAMWRADVHDTRQKLQTATQALRRRSTATALAGATTTVLAGLIARRIR